MAVRASTRTSALMAEWHAALTRLGSGRDVNQYVFNEVLRGFLTVVRVRVLDAGLFPSGALYFDARWRDRNPDVAVVHNNYIIGRERKLRRFRELGLWFLDGANGTARSDGV